MSSQGKQMVFDFSGSGTVEGLHFDSFDLGFLGDKTISRASEIIFNEDDQNWNILLPGKQLPECSAVEGFDTYDEARKFEVAWLQECRKAFVKPDTKDGWVIATQLRNMGVNIQET